MVEQTEIKVNLEGEQVGRAEDLFKLRRRDAQRMTVWFGEYLGGSEGTDSLPLLGAGVILRLRHKQGEPDDSTVKLRLPESAPPPAHLPEPAKSAKWTFRVEGDWSGAHRSVSASAVTQLNDDLSDRMKAERMEDEDFSSYVGLRQLAFLRQVTALPIDLGEIAVLGPIRARKWEPPATAHVGEGVVVERWEIDDLLLLEFSIRAPTSEADAGRRALEAMVLRDGIELSTEQETKTRRVLAHLTKAAGRDR